MLTRAQAYAISAETEIDPRTVRRAYEGQWVVPAIRTMIETAATKLGFAAPPPPPPRRQAKAVAGE